MIDIDMETKTEKKPKEPKAPSADARMLGMNWEALHDKVELYGLASIAAHFRARGMSGDRLTRSVKECLDAAREMKRQGVV